MKYFIFTDFSKWDAVNKRPYVGRDVTTTQLLDVFKHPSKNEWMSIIPPNSLLKTAKYLTTEELTDFQALLQDSIPVDWPEESEWIKI